MSIKLLYLGCWYEDTKRDRAIVLNKEECMDEIDTECMSVRKETAPSIASAIQSHDFLARFLIENFDQLFAKAGAEGKNYVVLFKGADESKEPEIQFFSKKKQVKDFICLHPEAVCGYRNFNDFAYYL